MDAGDAPVLYSRTWGDPAHPAVTFIHDATHDHRMWLPTILPLARDYRPVALDLPGCGSSPPLTEQPATVLAYARAVTATLRQLEVEFSVVVGSGFGAAVALALAASSPEAIAGLVLCDPVLSPAGYGAELITVGTFAAERGARAIGRGLAAAVADPFLARALRDRYARLDADGLGSIAAAISALPADAGRTATALRLPTLVLAAEGQGLPEAEAFALAAPPARLVVVRGADAPLVLHRPDRFVDALLRFFRDLQPGGQRPTPGASA